MTVRFPRIVNASTYPPAQFLVGVAETCGNDERQADQVKH